MTRVSYSFFDDDVEILGLIPGKTNIRMMFLKLVMVWVIMDSASVVLVLILHGIPNLRPGNC